MLSRALGFGYVEAMSFLVLTPALVLIAALFGRRTEVGRVASQTFLALGIAFVGSTLAVGFAPGAAAVYAAHHGVDVGSIAMMNDLRNYGFVLQVALLAGMTLALGVAALTDRIHTRWVGWGGVVVGSVGLVATPFVHNAVSMAWMIWWVGLSVLLLRGAPPAGRRPETGRSANKDRDRASPCRGEQDASAPGSRRRGLGRRCRDRRLDHRICPVERGGGRCRRRRVRRGRRADPLAPARSCGRSDRGRDRPGLGHRRRRSWPRRTGPSTSTRSPTPPLSARCSEARCADCPGWSPCCGCRSGSPTAPAHAPGCTASPSGCRWPRSSRSPSPALFPPKLTDLRVDHVDNPLAAPGVLGDAARALAGLDLLLGVVAIGLAVATLVQGYRRGGLLTRQQTMLFALAFLPPVAALVASASDAAGPWLFGSPRSRCRSRSGSRCCSAGSTTSRSW